MEFMRGSYIFTLVSYKLGLNFVGINIVYNLRITNPFYDFMLYFIFLFV